MTQRAGSNRSGTPDAREGRVAGVNRTRLPGAFRLKRRRLIDRLFDRSGSFSKSVTSGSIRLLYSFVPKDVAGTGAPVQVAFLLSRAVRPAVRRNALKRIMREAFRVQCGHIVNSVTRPSEVLLLGFLFRGGPAGKGESVAADVRRSIDKLLEREVRPEARSQRDGIA